MDDDITIFASNHCWLRTIQSISREGDLNKVKFFKCSKDKDDELNKVDIELF